MDKKISAQEAAFAVLAKAEEMLKSSKMAKAMTNHNEKGINNSEPNKDMVINKPHARHATSKMGNQVRSGNISGAKETAKKTVGQMASMPKPNLTKEAGAPAENDAAIAGGVQITQGKGIHKLSKFMGHRDEKRKSKATAAEPTAQTSMMEKGYGKNTPKGIETHRATDSLEDSPAPARMSRAAGYKERGDKVNLQIAVEGAKESHKEKLASIKAQPKPNLTKGGK